MKTQLGHSLMSELADETRRPRATRIMAKNDKSVLWVRAQTPDRHHCKSPMEETFSYDLRFRQYRQKLRAQVWNCLRAPQTGATAAYPFRRRSNLFMLCS